MGQLKGQIEELTKRLAKNESRFAQEMETLRQKSREEVTSIQKDRDAFKAELQATQRAFQEFKDEQAIKDLLVVKFDIDAIDDDLLTAKETKIEDLERQKQQLERKIQEVLKDMDLRLSNEQELNAKVQKFQSRCSNLESVLKEA